MILRNITTILLGLMVCFCLLSKQTTQTSHIIFDVPIMQDVVAEALDVDDMDDMDVSDEFIASPVLVVLPLLFIVLPIVFARRSSQPILPTPKRPPSL